MPEERDESPLDVADWVRQLPIRAPRDIRGVFHALAQFRRDDGLDSLLDRMDFTGIGPTAIYEAVLRRPPESRLHAVPPAGYDARAAFKEALLSNEFRANILPAFLGAFPDLGRDVFIHVPKCAGTDLVMNLGKRQPPLPSVLEDPFWLDTDEILTVLGGLTRALPFHDRVFIYGHMELGLFIDRCGLRGSDNVFSIIRDPMGLMVSQANYAIGRLRQDPLGTTPDSAETLRNLGLARLPADATDRDLKDLTVRALLDPAISFPNQACRHLGRGGDVSFADAIDMIVACDVELTTTAYYERWLSERWNVPRSIRHNSSETILSLHEARRYFRTALLGATAEDQKLYDLVSWALKQSGTASIRGVQIAQAVGDRDLLVFASGLAEDHATDDDRGIVTIEEPPFVARYLIPPTLLQSDSPEVETVLAVHFGASGNGRQFLGQGWSATESEFTWSDGAESTITLPACPQPGSYVLRLIGRPFTVKSILERQTIEISIDGEPAERCRIRDYTLIEVAVPPHLSLGGMPLRIALRFPDAARPRPMNGADDDRLLGLSLYRLTLDLIRPRAAA